MKKPVVISQFAARQFFPHLLPTHALACCCELINLHIKRHGLAIMRCNNAAEEPQEMRCAFVAAEFDGIALDTLKAGSIISMMVMPGGTHTITPEINGRAQQVSVLVDATSASELNKQLGILNASRGNKRAFFDFDHEGKISSGWPLEFAWQNQPAPGVYAKVELSEAGAKAIAGKNYRAFSIAAPIKRGNPARIVASEAFGELALGGLVNDPAFSTILPLWAKNAGAPSATETNNKETTMLTAQEIAALQAKNSELQNEITTLKAKQSRTELETEQLKAKQAEHDANAAKLELAALKAKNTEQADVIKAQRQKDAEAAVNSAIERGVIPAQNDTLKAKWQKACEENPEQIEMLNAMNGNPALQSERITAARGSVEITNESVINVVKAYAAKADAKERGLLYAKEIRGRMIKPEEFDYVIRAANTLGTVSGTLITQRTLDLLKINFPALGRISTNFTSQQFDAVGQGAKYNQTIATRLVTVPTVGTYHVDNGYVSANAVATDVPVTIDAHKFIQVDFNANEAQSTRRLLFGEQEEAMHYAIGLDLMDAIYALFTAANYTQTATTEALVDFDRSTVIDVGIAMQSGSAGRNANNGTRTVLLNPNYYGKLAEDTVVVSNLNNTQAGGAIATGVLPMVHGFMPVEAPNLITTGNLVGMGLRADAVALATALPTDYANQPGLPATALQQVVTNPDTGLSVQLTLFTNHQLGKTYMRLAWMRGQAVGNLKAGQRIISAAP